nr:unnamed protein product [Callosobruchus analis]
MADRKRLQGLIEVKPIARRRGRLQDSVKPKSASFQYFILESSRMRTAVCKQGLMSVYAVTHIQIQRLTTLLVAGESPRDLRGRHNNRLRPKSDELLVKIREHIERFPRKTTHYASQVQQYLDARLNVKTMHSLFIKENPELQHTVKYEFYLKYFKENYALRLGRPQVDACSECAKIRSKSLNANAKRVATAELVVHKRRAQKFYKKLQNVQKLCQETPDVAGIILISSRIYPYQIYPYRRSFISATVKHWSLTII